MMPSSSSTGWRTPCEKILQAFMQDPQSVPFLNPVPWKELHLFDYPKVIKNSCDLRQVERDFEQYKSPNIFATNMRLIWSNCMLYNIEGSPIYQSAEKLSKQFEQEFSSVPTPVSSMSAAAAAAALADVSLYTPERCEVILRKWLQENKQNKLWTGAFTVSTFNFGVYRADKERFHDKLSRVAHLISCWAEIIQPLALNLERMLTIPSNTSKDISKKLYEGLRNCPGVGPFNAYQVAVDVGYWRKNLFDEEVFTVAGPGAMKGVELCFETYTFPNTSIIKNAPKKTWNKKDIYEAEVKEVEVKEVANKSKKLKKRKRKRKSQPRLPYEHLIGVLTTEVNTRLLKNLGGISPSDLFYDRPEGKRQLNLMSMENCMCEISKYVRETGRNGRVRFPGGGSQASSTHHGDEKSNKKQKLIDTVQSNYTHTSAFLKTEKK